jgi:hypothetical protein
VSETTSSPAFASAQSLAATLTATPTKPSAVSTVSPAWTPTPTRIGSGPAAVAAAAAMMARPQRTAALAEPKTT